MYSPRPTIEKVHGIDWGILVLEVVLHAACQLRVLWFCIFTMHILTDLGIKATHI